MVAPQISGKVSNVWGRHASRQWTMRAQIQQVRSVTKRRVTITALLLIADCFSNEEMRPSVKM